VGDNVLPSKVGTFFDAHAGYCILHRCLGQYEAQRMNPPQRNTGECNRCSLLRYTFCRKSKEKKLRPGACCWQLSSSLRRFWCLALSSSPGKRFLLGSSSECFPLSPLFLLSPYHWVHLQKIVSLQGGSMSGTRYVVNPDFSRYVAVCPYSHPDNLMHNIVRLLLKYSGLFRRIAPHLDDILYGRNPRVMEAAAWQKISSHYS
jgi:hypothetical protein